MNESPYGLRSSSTTGKTEAAATGGAAVSRLRHRKISYYGPPVPMVATTNLSVYSGAAATIILSPDMVSTAAQGYHPMMTAVTKRRAASPGPPERRFGARVLLAACALVLVSVPFALMLFLVQDKWRPLARADAGARDDLHGYALDHGPFVAAMRLLSDVGSAPGYLAAFAVVIGWLLWRRLPRLAVFVAVTVVGSSLLNQAVKAAVDRSRPVLTDPVAHANGMSFPSGHAQAAVVGYSVLLLVFLPVLQGAWRPVAVSVAVLMVLGIGFSRVALGVHYVSDVLAGYILGAAWVSALTAAFNTWRVERGQRRTAPLEEGLEPEAGPQLNAANALDNAET